MLNNYSNNLSKRSLTENLDNAAFDVEAAMGWMPLKDTLVNSWNRKHFLIPLRYGWTEKWFVKLNKTK